MTRKEILDKAKDIVMGSREESYGKPENNFKVIADLWNDYLSPRCSERFINPKDVAIMLILLKVARVSQGNPKDDNWIDICGYASCGGEIESTKE